MLCGCSNKCKDWMSEKKDVEMGRDDRGFMTFLLPPSWHFAAHSRSASSSFRLAQEKPRISA